MRRIFKLFAPILLLALGDCGTVEPNIEMRFAGHLNHARSVQVVERALDRDDPGPEQVFVVDAGNTQLDLSQYDILGTVRVDMRGNGEIGVRNWIWFNNFESSGRFGWCVWQTPFKMVTLGIWNALPLAWPCGGGNPSDPAERLEYMSRYARRVAAEMGGDTMLLIESHRGNRSTSSEVALSGTGASYHAETVTVQNYMEGGSVFDDRNTGVTMLVLRKTRPGQAPLPDQPPRAQAPAPAHRPRPAKPQPTRAAAPAPAPTPPPAPVEPPAPIAAPEPDEAASPSAAPLPPEAPFGGRSGESESPYGARPELPQ